MKKNKKHAMSVREMVMRQQEIAERVREIADLCESEKRERTEEETAEFESLMRESQILQMRMQSAPQPGVSVPSYVSIDSVLRENLLHNNRQVVVRLMREGEEAPDGTVTGADEVNPQTTAALAETGIIPVHEQEMLKPIRKGLIWDKVGLPIRSGLNGKLRWPIHGMAVASFADEAERLTDSSIDFSKLEMEGSRMGVAVPVTREELEDSHGIVESVVREEMPNSIIDLINDALFTTSSSYTDKEGKTKTRKVMGPFVNAAKASKLITFAGAVPTRKELLLMVAKIAAKIDLKAPCFVMTEATKAELCDVKVDSGSGRFLCENDTILGYPVYTTSVIGADYIGFGDWSYQAAGFFGSMSLIADPYTLARRNSVDFVLNGRFGTATLREDAFAVGKVTRA